MPALSPRGPDQPGWADLLKPVRAPGAGWQPERMTEHRPRIYGSDHDDPDPYTPRPGHEYVELVGGPLDGHLLDVTGLTAEDRADGALLIAPLGTYGPGGRADYEPRTGAPGLWDWAGDTA